jgi:hypothetical protein
MWNFYYKNHEAGNKNSFVALIEIEARKLSFWYNRQWSKYKPETRKIIMSQCSHGACIPTTCLPDGPKIHILMHLSYSTLGHVAMSATTVIREDSTTDQITLLLVGIYLVMHTPLYCAYVGDVLLPCPESKETSRVGRWGKYFYV